GEVIERTAGAAVLLGDGEPEYTGVGQRLPEGWGASVRIGLVQSTHQAHGALRRQQRAQRRGELALFSGRYRFHAFPLPSLRWHCVGAVGDDVTQDLVGTSTEAHQRGGAVKPFEFAGQGRV